MLVEWEKYSEEIMYDFSHQQKKILPDHCAIDTMIPFNRSKTATIFETNQFVAIRMALHT